jgi:hypothetical protein
MGKVGLSTHVKIRTDNAACRLTNEHNRRSYNDRKSNHLSRPSIGANGQWVELFNDPLLGSVRHVHSRDVRIAGILAVFFGAFFSRAIHQSPAGPVGAMGVLCALRFGQIWWWVFTPAVPVKTEGKV